MEMDSEGVTPLHGVTVPYAPPEGDTQMASPQTGPSSSPPLRPTEAAQPCNNGALPQGRQDIQPPQHGEAPSSSSSTSPSGATQTLNNGALSQDQAGPLTPGSYFNHLLRNSDFDADRAPYPCAREEEEEPDSHLGPSSNLPKGSRVPFPDHPDRPSHTPGPYTMIFAREEDLPRTTTWDIPGFTPPDPFDQPTPPSPPRLPTAPPLLPEQQLGPVMTAYYRSIRAAPVYIEDPPPQPPQLAQPPLHTSSHSHPSTPPPINLSPGTMNPTEIHDHLHHLASKIGGATLRHDDFEGLSLLAVHLESIYKICAAHKLPPPGIPPPKPVAGFTWVIPLGEWGIGQFKDKLGGRDPSKEEQDGAAVRVQDIHLTLTGKQGRLSQIPHGTKCTLSQEMMAICSRFGVPLPSPHAPLFFTQKVWHSTIWEALATGIWEPRPEKGISLAKGMNLGGSTGPPQPPIKSPSSSSSGSLC
uniref:Uncharacterized protein n=1 Tax=Eutreptiella gymnastica TaxID=73025 RepID=A0A7S1I1C9_9EUGL